MGRRPMLMQMITVGAVVAMLPATSLSAGQTTKTTKFEALAATKKCDCSTVPWKPEPPCVKSCSGLLLSSVSEQELVSGLRLTSATRSRISALKEDGFTQEELDGFLTSSAGKEFTASLQKAQTNEVKALVAIAETNAKKGKP